VNQNQKFLQHILVEFQVGKFCLFAAVAQIKYNSQAPMRSRKENGPQTSKWIE
jgi:hypothetical protein